MKYMLMLVNMILAGGAFYMSYLSNSEVSSARLVMFIVGCFFTAMVVVEMITPVHRNNR